MTRQPTLYDVTITQLATYTAKVVASTPDEACEVADDQLARMLQPTGFSRTQRDIQSSAVPAPMQPRIVHSVTAGYRMQCAQMIPADSEHEAKEHFRRLLELNGPIDYYTGDFNIEGMDVEQSSPNGGHGNA